MCLLPLCAANHQFSLQIYLTRNICREAALAMVEEETRRYRPTKNYLEHLPGTVPYKIIRFAIYEVRHHV
jgi:hypothetical protein